MVKVPVLAGSDTVMLSERFHDVARVAQYFAECTQSEVEGFLIETPLQQNKHEYKHTTAVGQSLRYVIQQMSHEAILHSVGSLHYGSSAQQQLKKHNDISRNWKTFLEYTTDDRAALEEDRKRNVSNTIAIGASNENIYTLLSSSIRSSVYFTQRTICDYADLLNTAFHSILLWLCEHDIYLDFFQKFSTVLRTIPDEKHELQRFAAHVAIRVYMITLFQNVVQNTVQADLPWEWQSQLIANEMLDHAGSDPAVLRSLYDEAMAVIQDSISDDDLEDC